MPCRDWFCKIDKAECLGPAIHLTIDGVLDEVAGEGRLTRATLRSVPGLFAFARGAGRFNERRCCGFAFVLVDQCLKLRRECRVGRTYRQPLEEESPFIQLPASRLLDQLAFGSVHPGAPRRFIHMFARPPAILERDRATAASGKTCQVS
mgnify:CR=1 FL=1